MVSAAARAAKVLSGVGRNRPSRSMSKKSSDAGGAEDSTSPSSTGGGPQFMESTYEQYESLSEKLARENAATQEEEEGDGDNNKMSRKVRWAETARIASTMDAANAAAEENDEYTSNPLDVLSDLFQKKYTLPIFLVLTTFIFLLVHLTGGNDENSFERYNPYNAGEGGGEDGGSKLSYRFGLMNRQKNIGGGDGFGDVIFSLTPTTSDQFMDQSSNVPTVSVIHHTTPKVAPLSGAQPSVMVGNDPSWILVPTRTGILGGLLSSDEREDGGPTTLKWGFGPGVPTPDPALLNQHLNADPDKGSPTTLKWNLGIGVPTPDPALLLNADPDAGSPTNLKWNYPPGVPTPDPALLIEISPPHGGPDDGSPTTLKWAFPPGIPTPDPALLVGVPDELVWGYPPGVPTPDPVLLTGGIETPQMEWGYPPGIPTPDPALLTGAVKDPVGWGYPEGEPTPDPALLNGIVVGTEAPTSRQVEVAMALPPPPPTTAPVTKPIDLTLKTVDITPIQPREPPPPVPQVEVLPVEPPPPTPQPVKFPDTEVGTTLDNREPTIPRPPPEAPKIDQYGNPVEMAIPERQPRPPGRVPARPPRAPTNPQPKVNVQPYGQAPGSYTLDRPPGYTDPFYSGPNGVTLHHPGHIPEQPGVYPQQPGIYPQQPGGIIIPQVPQQSCGCCCCNCGGGSVSAGAGGMTIPFTSQGYVQHIQQLQQGGIGLPMQQAPYMHQPIHLGVDPALYQVPQLADMPQIANDGTMANTLVYPASLAPTETPGCPWDCVIDETVGTWGKSNEDDAIYEIFYTNPLNCCGTIVEIGAGDGIKDSTSFFFEQGMNWTTYLTEANPTDFESLSTNRKGKKVKAINGAFCKEGPFLYFDAESKQYESLAADDYSSEPMGDIDVTNDTPKVSCIRLDKILTGITHVNVMVIRVKGDPWAVIRTMDWDISVDIWLIDFEQKDGALHNTIRSALKLHDYVPAAWDIKLWCDNPANCVDNEVWLRKGFNPIRRPLLQQNRHLLRGGIDT